MLVNLNNKGTFQLTPNPAKDIVRVTGTGIKKIEVFTNNGGKVWSSNVINQSTIEINLQHLARGIYVVKIYDIDGVPEIQRLILK